MVEDFYNLGKQEAQNEFRKMIDDLDKLWFAYGNAIDDCFKDKDFVEAKRLFDKFYVKYEELKSELGDDGK